MVRAAAFDVSEPEAPEVPVALPTPKLRLDYTPPSYLVTSVDLHFSLEPSATLVSSKLQIQQNPKASSAETLPPLVLDGDKAVKLLSLSVNGTAVEDFVADPEGGLVLSGETIEKVAGKEGALLGMTVECKVEIDPANNTELEGLYMSGGNFCTQCEAEGFRRITFFPDRPDVMAKYTTTIVANKESYPVLLSNGNAVETKDLEDGRHMARYEDPFPKPSYLFALVAGDLVFLEDKFRTMSGRDVVLRIYVRDGDLAKCPHAMMSLKQSMRWDEEVYGREYDLDLFNIVAVNDFNMGAMENKSLNIFNSRCVLVSQETATDADFNSVQGIVAHEYFHNWTGNRITCRDWFQLSLKEGLTVFRDQEFSGDMTSKPVSRIKNVMRLRESQFPQDSGPMAHPVRPDSYLEINNFYSTTVYNKGAEVIRMLRTLVGTEGYRKGTDLYFARHDGEAVTCDDWVAAIQDANPTVDLGQFKRWYSQAGTPRVDVDVTRDDKDNTLILKMTQKVPDTPGQTNKEPMVIPIVTGLVSKTGSNVVVDVEDGSAPQSAKVLILRDAEQSFRLRNVPSGCLPSLLRGFSAPVRMHVTYNGQPESLEQIAQAMAFDNDEFNRWEAGQKLALKLLKAKYSAVTAGGALDFPDSVSSAFRTVLTDKTIDDSFRAQMFRFPSENFLAEEIDSANPDAIHESFVWFKKSLASALRKELAPIAFRPRDKEFDINIKAQGRRAIRGIAIDFLASLEDPDVVALCYSEAKTASTMTEVLTALAVLAKSDTPEREDCLNDFYQTWKGDLLVVGKWLGLQAGVPKTSTLDDVKALLEHESFNLANPNNVYSVIGGFCLGNPYGFHSRKNESYEFLADQVLALDKINAQVAARMVSGFTKWRQYDEERQGLLRAQLERLKGTAGLSKNTFEIVAKALTDTA